MIRLSRLCLTALLLVPQLRWPATAQVVIDNFDTNQGLLTAPGTTASTVSGSMIGAERDLQLTLTAGSPLSIQITGGVLAYTQGGAVTGSADIVWDGADGDP